MLLYSKLYDLLTKSGNGKFELKCTIKELFGRNDSLKYIYFQTESEISCLLNISSKHEIKMDTLRILPDGTTQKNVKKFLSLSRWTDSRIGFDAVIAVDPEMTMVKEIKANSSPYSFIDLLKKIYPSLTSIPYRAALLSHEYLLVLNDAGDVDVYYVKGPKHTKLLIVVDLEILLFKNIIPEVERVHRSILELLQDSNETYWESLLELLKKCQQFKIITKGKLNLNHINKSQFHSGQTHSESIIIDQSMKINMSHKAIKLALECFDKK
jgi:hypothetical protein